MCTIITQRVECLCYIFIHCLCLQSLLRDWNVLLHIYLQSFADFKPSEVSDEEDKSISEMSEGEDDTSEDADDEETKEPVVRISWLSCFFSYLGSNIDQQHRLKVINKVRKWGWHTGNFNKNDNK